MSKKSRNSDTQSSIVSRVEQQISKHTSAEQTEFQRNYNSDGTLDVTHLAKTLQQKLGIKVEILPSINQVTDTATVNKLKEFKAVFLAEDNIPLSLAIIDIIVARSSDSQLHHFASQGRQKRIANADAYALKVGKQIFAMRENKILTKRKKEKKTPFQKIAKILNESNIQTPLNRGKWSTMAVIRTFDRYIQLTQSAAHSIEESDAATIKATTKPH